MVWKQLVTLVVGKYVGGISYVASGWKIVPTCSDHAGFQDRTHKLGPSTYARTSACQSTAVIHASSPRLPQRHTSMAGSRVCVPEKQWAHRTGGMQRPTACMYRGM